MTPKEFLSQCYRLNIRIDSKMEQIASLNELATKCTPLLTGMPHSPNRGVSSMEDAIAEIVDVECEIADDILKLVEVRRQIIRAIRDVDNKDYQTLLELRFLCGKTWEDVASKMGYSIQHTFRIRDRALAKVRVPQVESKGELRSYVKAV